MEAEHSRSADEERSGGQQQALPESSRRGRLPQKQEQVTSRSSHGSYSRHQHRQPKRRDMLQRQQQQQSQVEESSWQLQDVPGPSGHSYSSLESSTKVSHFQSIASHPSQEIQEGTTSRRERKPQKPGKYVCSYCGRPCAKPSVLQKHIRSHTGERPYPCVPCGFSFKTKSNLYKHRKSHAHRIKAGLASSREEHSFSGTECGTIGDEQEEGTEAESTESEDETRKHRPSTSQERPALKKSSKVELSFSEEGPRTEHSQAIKQRLAMRLSERKRVPLESPDENPASSLGPSSKGSTESGYFSSYGSAELSQVSPPNADVKSYAEIILGKYGRLGQQQRIAHQHPQSSSSSSLGQDEKSVSFSVPKTQVIEHITKLITINEAVVDTSEIDSVKPRRSSLSRRSSTEAAKVALPKDSCLYDPKADVPSTSGSTGSVMFSATEGQLLQDTLVSHCLTGVFLRSQSVPSSTGQDDPASISSHSFRLSQSFDEQQAASAEMRVGHHHRMLRRQPAIEMPIGVDLVAEAGSSASTVAELAWKQQKGSRLYECDLCGTCLKNQNDYEAHRAACKKKPLHVHQSVEKPGAKEDYRQMMHYKFKAMAMAIRKRRKEESLEEDPPSPGPAAITFSSQPTTSTIGTKDVFSGFTGIPSQIESYKTGPYKEISVIQHTSSFEKQESMSLESQESELERKTSQELKQVTSTARLVRQPKIQVPEILVTKEPDAEMVSPPASASVTKELEKEEFQWPQRSQSLAQLPAEKLPPKKKRLRLAEVLQSSGDSSFESVSLTRSPSQESNVSHTSSRSTSFDESGKIEPENQGGTWSSQGSHMLTVPGTHQHYLSHREMHRSASEQAPSSPLHPDQIVETRSKSFDCGLLSLKPTSTTWKEKRKCLLVKHATLEKPDHEEPTSSLHHFYPGRASLSVGDHRTSNTARPGTETLQLFQAPYSNPTTVCPLTSSDSFSSQQVTGLVPITTAISEVLSSHMFQQALMHTVPSSLHPRLHSAEPLGLPVRHFTNLLSMQYPSSGLTIHDPSLREPSTFPSSTCRRVPSYHQLVAQHQHRPVIATCLEQLRPMVSLVVPVRLQTHIPSYANALYTTISQLLATKRSYQPVCCTAMVIMGKFECSKLQQSYLRLSTPCIPLSLPLEFGAESASEDSCGPLSAGGSKRMLSPAGSLELSLEAQRQQKRIKEEEEEANERREDKSSEKFLKESHGTDKDELRNRHRAGSVMEKEQENKVTKTESVLSEISQVETGLKTEDKLEKDQRCVAVVEIPERTTDPLYTNLHTTTSVSWCYLNYTKPTPSANTNPQTSVYSSWNVSMYNPNLPGMSTKMVLSLLCSKQRHSSEMYTTAMTQLSTDELGASSEKIQRVSKVHAKAPSSSIKDKEQPGAKRVEKKESAAEEAPSTSKQSDPLRIRVFEGGYKSNEEYVYVRGRGRGKYVCGECGIRCKKPSMLKKHIRTHTDIRPYVCKHCNFAFKTKGNLTKHMKSKAHGKKCQVMGVPESSVEELEASEAGTSERQVWESEDQEEHQFSDNEDSEDEDDEEDNEEEEDLSSHDDPLSSCSTDTRQSDQGLQIDPTNLTFPEREEREAHPSPLRKWSSGRAISPDSRRALFSHKAWEHSPRAFSPASEGSPLHSLSPRLELSPPSRHLSPSPERGPSPLAASTLRTLSPLRPLSPGRYRSSRARLSPAPLRTQHRAHSSPGHFHWESCTTQFRESQQERPSTPITSLAAQRLSPSHVSLVPSTLRFPHSDPPIHQPVPPRTADHMFSHLPLHSQQQARMPYHMIPIGGIQMVQLRPRSCKLERASSSTLSPTSPKEEGLCSPSRSSWSPSWSLQPGTSQDVYERQSLEKGTKLHCTATSSSTAKSSLFYDACEQIEDRKQYGSSWPFKTHTTVHETFQKKGQGPSEETKCSSELAEKEPRAYLHKPREHLEAEEHKDGQSKKHDSLSEETAGEKPVPSQDSNPSST